MHKKSARSIYLPVALLIALTAAAYLQVLNCDFINLDDNVYVTGNYAIRQGLTAHGITWALTTFRASNWHPLAWLSHMLDVQLYGMNPLGHHLSGLVLHIANALLLFFLLSRLTGYRWRSALVAALFAVHPLHVESVAWVSERKDVLSTFFWMLTTYAYVGYVERPSARRYALVMLAFAFGLMAKPMLVTLPLTLLLLDYWPLGRLQVIGYRLQGDARSDQHPTPKTQPRARLVIEKTPLFALAAGSCVVTFMAQSRGGAVGTLQDIPLGVRIDNAAVSCVNYLAKMIWPRDLAIAYPHPLNSLPEWQVAGSFALLAAVTVAVVLARRSRPYLLVGWLWYLITLAPVIGLVQVGMQAMADRYTYIPLIGIFVAVVWLLGELLGNYELRITNYGVRIVRYALACAVVAVLAVCTWGQVGFWRNSITLFEHSVKVQPSSLAHNSLGFALDRKGRRNEAIRHFREAIRISPNYPDPHVNLGAMLAAQQRFGEAEKQFREALRIAPTNPNALFGMGRILEERRDPEGARRYLEQSVSMNRDYAAAQLHLGALLATQGETDQAIEHLQQAIRLEPSHAESHYRLALALETRGRAAEAIEHYRIALGIQPRSADIANNLAWALATCPDPALRAPEEAIRIAEKACADSKWKESTLIDTLASAYAAAGRFEDAVKTERRALELARAKTSEETTELAGRMRLFQSHRAYIEGQ